MKQNKTGCPKAPRWYLQPLAATLSVHHGEAPAVAISPEGTLETSPTSYLTSSVHLNKILFQPGGRLGYSRENMWELLLDLSHAVFLADLEFSCGRKQFAGTGEDPSKRVKIGWCLNQFEVASDISRDCNGNVGTCFKNKRKDTRVFQSTLQSVVLLESRRERTRQGRTTCSVTGKNTLIHNKGDNRNDIFFLHRTNSAT